MNRRTLSPGRLMTLGAMVTALTVLCIFAASTLPAGRAALLFFSSIFICVLTCEQAYLTALLSYIASALIAFFMVPDKLPVFVYILLLGHYGIMREALNARVNGRVLRILIKILYCDVFIGLAVFLSLRVLTLDIILPGFLPVWAVVLIAQACVIVFDLLFGACAAIYRNRFRNIIIPRR